MCNAAHPKAASSPCFLFCSAHICVCVCAPVYTRASAHCSFVVFFFCFFFRISLYSIFCSSYFVCVFGGSVVEASAQNRKITRARDWRSRFDSIWHTTLHSIRLFSNAIRFVFRFARVHTQAFTALSHTDALALALTHTHAVTDSNASGSHRHTCTHHSRRSPDEWQLKFHVGIIQRLLRYATHEARFHRAKRFTFKWNKNVYLSPPFRCHRCRCRRHQWTNFMRCARFDMCASLCVCVRVLVRASERAWVRGCKIYEDV